MKTCFMFGHSTANYDALPRIEAAVQRHYLKYGIRIFMIGRGGVNLLKKSFLCNAPRRPCVKEALRVQSLFNISKFFEREATVEIPLDAMELATTSLQTGFAITLLLNRVNRG